MSSHYSVIANDLVDHFGKGDCVLFVGDALDGQAQSQRLATALADKGLLHSACPLPACHEKGRCALPGQCALPFHRVAQLFESIRGRNELVRYVRDLVEAWYPSQPVQPIWRAVASLSVRIIVTTAYDQRLEEALRRAGRQVNAVVKDANVPFDDPDWVQLIYLRGRLDQPDDSLTLTSDDAADIFGRLPMVATILRGHFASKTLFFLGYNLSDPYFETLYQQVSRPIGNLMRRAFGVQWPATPLAVDRWRNKIDLAQVEPLDYLKGLAGRIHANVQERQAGALPPTPYKFLDYFTEADQAIFFGRDLEADLLLSTVLAHRFSVFYGRSGVGKTSLLLAEMGPKLKAQDYRVVYARMLGDPANEVKAAVRGVKLEELAYADRGRRMVDVLTDAVAPTDRLVVVLDQFEEFFLRQSEKARRAFAQELRDCMWPNPRHQRVISQTPFPLREGKAEDEGAALDLRVVLSLRDDYLGYLDELSSALPHDVFAHRYRIQNLDVEKATLAIMKPAERFGLPVAGALCERLVADLEDRGVEPANLQIVLHELYQDAQREGLWDEQIRRGTGLTLDRYLALGGTPAILTGYLDRVLAELVPAQQEQARTILKSMVTAQRTKAVITGQEIVAGDLVAQLGAPVEEVRARLAFLRNRGVVRKFGDEDRYELAHEVMVGKVWQWVGEDDLRLLDVRDMLRRAMSDYDKFGHLLDLGKLALLDSYRAALVLESGEAELLFRSALAVGHEAPAWFERAQAAGVTAEIIAQEGLASDNFRTRAAAIAALAELGKGFANDLIPMLADVYPQVRVAAIAALERLYPDGAWRSHLKYECYVPSGEFIMGDDENESTHREKKATAHSCWVEAFYIGKYPVTNLEYARFMTDQGRHFDIRIGEQDHPVTHVTWYNARDYAEWAHMRLLTEAEWEKAASWEVSEKISPKESERKKRRWPWGNEFEKERCNSIESGIGMTTPVGTYSPAGDSPCGAVDMAGNVWEWCSSLYKDYPYRHDDDHESMKVFGYRVQRGGSFNNMGFSARCAARGDFDPVFRNHLIGFRVGLPSALEIGGF